MVSVPRLAAVFSQTELSLLGYNISPVTGLGFGLIVELSLYYIITTWFDIYKRHKKLHWVLPIVAFIQTILLIILLAPGVEAALVPQNQGHLYLVLVWYPFRVVWGVIAVAIPALSLMGVAAASILSKTEPAKVIAKDTKLSKAVAKKPTIYHCKKCDRSFDNYRALNGHQKLHSVRKEKSDD